MTEEVTKAKKILTKSTGPKLAFKEKDLLRTSSTLLDLCCTNSLAGGLAKGGFYFIVGDSQAGKTVLANALFAEAAINKAFDGYRFVYSGPEYGSWMDMNYFFGSRAASRIEPPRLDKTGSAVQPTTVEEFYYDLDDLLKEGEPFIKVLDSMDALGSDDDEQKFYEKKKASRNGKGAPGSYGTGKARMNSGMLRRFMTSLEKSRSILVVISQTRQMINSMFPMRTRSGGDALRFYAQLEFWLSVKKTLTKVHKDNKEPVGVLTEVKVKKNRFTGRTRTIQFPIYYSSGIDDVGSCVDYLIHWKHWTKSGGTIKVPLLGFTGSREALIQHIEREGKEPLLRRTVKEVWDEVEGALSVVRKRKYG